MTIRTLAIKVLQRHGYQVIAGASAQEVLEKVVGCLESVDMLLTDVVM